MGRRFRGIVARSRRHLRAVPARTKLVNALGTYTEVNEMPSAKEVTSPAQSSNRRAIIVGGSIAGLFAAAFLRRIGWQVDIYERSSIELIGRGVGIFAGHFELLEALDRCGAGTVDIGVMAYRRIALNRAGAVVAEKPMLQIVTSWDRLRQLLVRVIDRQRYRFGHVFEHVEQDSRRVHVRFANGHTERADLLIACDGIRSSVCAPNLHRKCSQFTPAIISGEVPRMNPTSRSKPEEPSFPTFASSWTSNCKPWATRSRARMTS